MAKKMTKRQLVAAYKELDKVVGIDPPIDYEDLSMEAFAKELQETVEELVEPGDEFSETTQSVFDQLKEQREGDDEKPAPEKEAEKEEQEEPEEEEKPKPKKEKEKTEGKEKPPKKEGSKKAFTAPSYNRIDAICDALKMKPVDIKDWVDKADEILEEKGGSIKPSTINTRFEVNFFYKIAKHIDLGELPPKKKK